MSGRYALNRLRVATHEQITLGIVAELSLSRLVKLMVDLVQATPLPGILVQSDREIGVRHAIRNSHILSAGGVQHFGSNSCW